jgi:UDP-4-amino-4-deoxy-L-arabinose formyltransferase/UDP-glucuronic acid dehydrogenase (UDP-4-keto-hexauronic acid decarboxylating)
MRLNRVVVFGYDELLLAHLDVLQEVGAEVAAVVVPHSQRSGPALQVRAEVPRRGHRALEHPASDFPAFLAALKGLRADLFLAWSYPLILPAPVLALPPGGALNLHFGLLPRYRGASAFRWAVANGETETGVTLHEMTAAPDAGPVLAAERVPIAETDEIAQVMRNMRDAGMRLLRQSWAGIAEGTAPRHPQDEAAARLYPRFEVEQARIDWTLPNRGVRDHIRSLTPPFPGARTSYAGQPLIVLKAVCLDAPHTAPPGTILGQHPAGPVVACGNGALALTRVARPPGAAQGPLPIAPGGRFGGPA